VAPDGAVAAVVVGTGRGQVGLAEVDLRTGATRRLTVPVSQDTSSQTMVWSPDSRWLFVVTSAGQLTAIDTATWTARPLGVALPPLTALAVRTAPAARLAAP